MSRLFGPITQNGYVVRNLDEAMKFWIEVLGVGPFFVLPAVKFEQYCYRGALSSPELRIGLANSGGLQIELIEQTNDAPSCYKDFLDCNGPGLQHVSVWSEQFDVDRAAAAARGCKVLAEGSLPGGVRFMFYDTELHGGAVMEMLDLRPDVKARMALIREAAMGWDGTQPIRMAATPTPSPT